MSCLEVIQPIGKFYIGSIKASDLCNITQYDFRRLSNEEGFESYIGINRKVDQNRENEIAQYVGTSDACFPTSIILSIPAACTHYDHKSKILKLKEYIDKNDSNKNISSDKIATVLDGQHRIAGLKKGTYQGEFELNVSIFIDLDIADQAYIFSTINLAQTKVNRSLVYDLYDLAKARSPQKVCHNIAVALDKDESSPFYKAIKRLGVATEGRYNERITQATFVDSLICYLTDDARTDRELYKKGKKPQKASADELKKMIFRNMFIDEKDLDITDVIWNYFDAISDNWEKAWCNTGSGIMLKRTNGFRAFMRFLRPAYLHITSPGSIPTKKQFMEVLKKIDIKDAQFNTDIYKPGTGGESKLYNELREKSKI